jgi:AcrR family transcriptional regulator
MPRITAPTLAEHRDQRRSALLQAGQELLAQLGPAGVTMAAVAARTGLSRPAVYEYFPSTADLLAAVLLEHMETWTLQVHDAITQLPDPQDRIDEYVFRSLRFFREDNHQSLALTSEASLPPEVRQRLTDAHQSIISPLIEAITELGIHDALQAAQFIQGVIEAAARRLSSDIDDEAHAAQEFIRAGLAHMQELPMSGKQ